MKNHVHLPLRGGLDKVTLGAIFFCAFLNHGRQDFSPLAAFGLKMLVGGGILKKPLPAVQAYGCFVCCSLESKVSLSRTKKPLTV